MERVRALLSDLEVVPTFTDDDAKRALESQTLDGFLIGGGVEPTSREARSARPRPRREGHRALWWAGRSSPARRRSARRL